MSLNCSRKRDRLYLMKTFQVKKYRIFSEKVSQGQCIRLAFLSDLHGFCYGVHNSQLVQAVEDACPDAVLAGGDMIVGGDFPRFESARALFLSLAERFPVYYAFGNHERRLMDNSQKYGQRIREFCEQLRGHGIQILRNGRAHIEQRDGIPLTIWGWDADLRFYRRLRTGHLDPSELERALGHPDEGAYHVLMAHNPQFGQAYFSWGADLALCGHYHGGVWRFTENRGLVAPNLHVFPAYCCGLFSRGSQHMAVSPGLGEHTIRLRIRNPRELFVLEIMHGGGV